MRRRLIVDFNELKLDYELDNEFEHVERSRRQCRVRRFTMKMSNMTKTKTHRHPEAVFALATGVLVVAVVLAWTTLSFGLTAGTTYTIEVDKIASDGTVTDLSLSTTATADSDGKLAFTMSGVPDNSSCNFLVITIKDNTGTVVRRSVVPCPNAGDTLPVGVSGITNAQADALIAALKAAGSDDPILVVFGYAIVRSSSINATDLSTMATIAQQGIDGSGGYVDYLTQNGVTSDQLAAYRSDIVSQLADPTDGYTKLFKDAVDTSDSSTAASKRGKAAALLLQILVKAATNAGFSQDRVIEAFNAMGAIVVPLMDQAVKDGTLSAKAKQMVDSSIGGGIDKIRAHRVMEKFSAALKSLGASGADVTQYQTAAQTLLDAMLNAFAEFDKVFNGNETQATIQAADQKLRTDMQTAFDTFMSDVAASNARLDTMIANIDSALGQATGLTRAEFQFYDSKGNTVNWAITMVIPTDWVSSIVSAGGELLYTRDTTAIPNSVTWLGTCSDQSYQDRNSCENAGGTWTAARTDFVADGVPTSYASLLGLKEDVEILEFARWDAQSNSGQDMSKEMQIEKQFADSMAKLVNNLGGTTNGTDAIGAKLLGALVILMQSPQF
ncbi:MAG TPA: hypothetical protein ENJ37_10170 [Deltaproteobacteria bacterium]|nr:hypothetical protein [Deltaproteobacteria bacterium]